MDCIQIQVGSVRLGELTWPDNRCLQDYRKIILFKSTPKSFQFTTLAGHKADGFFEGSLQVVFIRSTELGDDAWGPFTRYLSLRDRLFPPCRFNELWRKEDSADLSSPSRPFRIERRNDTFLIATSYGKDTGRGCRTPKHVRNVRNSEHI